MKIVRPSNYSSRKTNKDKYLYTKGFQFSLNGVNYIGEYHKSGDEYRTGPEPSKTSQLLTKYYSDPILYAYDKAKNFPKRPRVEPNQIVFTPDEADYRNGFAIRYFVERSGKFEGYPLEIDKKQANKFGTANGIDEGAYNLVSFRWKLVGPRNTVVINSTTTIEGVYEHNVREVYKASAVIPNMIAAIKNYVEFARFTTT